MALKFEDIKNKVIREMYKIDEIKLYYECKKLKMRLQQRHTTKSYLLICLALHNLGLPVTSELIAPILGKSRQNVKN
jgi:hypothetical protein